jgi:PPOX class probable F420-dependent enzyme
MAHPFDGLRAHRYVRLTTYRATGEEVPTPVWFAMVGDTVYVETGWASGKARRIRRDARVVLTPCTSWGRPRGSDVPAVATDLGPDAPADVRAALLRRYGPLQRLRESLLRRRDITPTFLAIAPAAP